MKDKVISTIKEYNMLNKGDRVAVGLSGGADSMSLLYVLNEIKDEFQISLVAAHLNHSIRGKEADRDEDFVREYCSVHGIPIEIQRLNIPKLSEESGESIELCARNKRYEFFSSLAVDKIATAHNGSDRVETLLMNLSRGSGLNGLCSIPPVRDNIIRPFIDITRSEIEEFCALNCIPYVNDSTNFSDEYTRNKYRHNVIPELKNINPSFELNALRAIRSIYSENAYISKNAETELKKRLTADGKMDIAGFSEFVYGFSSRVLISYLKTASCDYETKHLNYILEKVGESFSIEMPGGKRILSDGKYLYCNNDDFRAEQLPELILDKNSISDCFCVAGRFTIEISDKIPDNQSNCYIADADKILDRVFLRGRQSGDVFHFEKRRCSKSLKKLFNELKIPKENRNNIYIIADENGLIFVENIGVDAKRCISSQSQHFMIIKTECGNNE